MCNVYDVFDQEVAYFDKENNDSKQNVPDQHQSSPNTPI
jgi:hypothetical protein